MPGSLSETERASYARDGYVFPVPALTDEEARTARDRILAFEAETGLVAGHVIRNKGHLKLLALYELARHRAVLDAVESVLGPDLLCWGSSLFVKPPGDEGFIAWHQDAHYWGLEPDDVCSAWIALEPSTLDNGAMQVIPGSHRERHLPHAASPASSANMLFSHEEIAVEVDTSQAVALMLGRGEMSLHHVNIVHGSEPNRSATPRMGFAIRYVAPHVRQAGDRASATLVRGTDRHGNFAPDPVPGRDMDPDIVAFVDAPLGPTPVGARG